MTGFERKGQASSARPLDWATQARLARFSGLCFTKSIAGEIASWANKKDSASQLFWCCDRVGATVNNIVRGKCGLPVYFFLSVRTFPPLSARACVRCGCAVVDGPTEAVRMQGKSSAHGSIGHGLSPTHHFLSPPLLRLEKMQSAGKNRVCCGGPVLILA